MELLDEDFQKRKKKNKSTTIILIAIIILLIVIATIIILMLTLKEDKLVVSIDGSTANKVNELLVFDDSNPNKVYIPIRDIAPYLGYKDYSGEYDNLSETSSKCYVQNENEVVNFSLNSNEIYKKITTENNDYELLKIDEPVVAMNGKLYTTIDGAEKAYNVKISYNPDQKQIVIFTMPYLINWYSTQVLDYGYEAIDEDFNNQKTVLEDLLVVKKDNKYAVITVEGEKILEDKYEKIQYLQYSSDFLVTSNNKVGIISKARETKVGIIYDEIKLMDYSSKLYLVKKDNKYGVIDNVGNIKIYPEYDQIGIDSTNFKENGIKNSYILLDTLIPLKKDKLWGLANINGKLVVDFKYTELGYLEASSTTGSNLLLIPDYDVIVVKKDEKYTVITAKGDEIWPAAFDAIYLSISSGNLNYIMSGNNKTWNLIEKLEEQGIGKKKVITDDKLVNTNETDANETDTNTTDADDQNTEKNVTE